MTSRAWGFVAIIVTAFLWGMSFLSIKVSVAVLPPMTLALTRFTMASVLLLVVLKWREPQTRLKPKDYFLMSMAGLLGVTTYFYFENNGVKLTSASAASIIIATIPIVTLIADAIIFGTKLTVQKLAGVLLSAVGVYFVVGADLDTVAGSSKGYTMMLGAAAAWVGYSLVTKPLAQRYSKLAIVCYQTIIGTVALVPFSLMETTNWAAVSTAIWFNVAYLGVFCSALGYYLYVYALDHLGIDVSTLFINLIPVVAVTASYFILQEPIALQQVLGGILVVLSVYLVSWKGKTATLAVVEEA